MSHEIVRTLRRQREVFFLQEQQQKEEKHLPFVRAKRDTNWKGEKCLSIYFIFL